MRLVRGNKYRINWLDAVQTSEWTDEKEIEKFVSIHEKGIKQDLIFVKTTQFYNVFTTGIHQGDKTYFDLILIPKKWTKTVKAIR